jgi:hypothetical protein
MKTVEPLPPKYQTEKKLREDTLCSGLFRFCSTLLIFGLILTIPKQLESYPTFSSWTPFFNTPQQEGDETAKLQNMIGPDQPASPEHPGELVSIANLLSDPNLYHRKIVKVRGIVTQPELHLEESGLFIRFVFVLKDAEDSLIVFGHHDRTQGNIQIETNKMVEVIGIFWKERTANDHHFRNNLEAMIVKQYPPLEPNTA